MTENVSQPNEMEKGIQPLDKLMTELGLTNANLVDISKDQLTFRMVAKGRKGRRIKLRIQSKILRALSACVPTKVFSLSDLFNYQGPDDRH